MGDTENKLNVKELTPGATVRGEVCEETHVYIVGSH